MKGERNNFGATASHSPNYKFEYPVVEERMEQIGVLVSEAQNLTQGVAEMYKKFGLIKLGKYGVFDMLIGYDGKYPLVEFTTKDDMNGWLFLPAGYGDKEFIEQEVYIINSLFKQLEEGKVVILSSDSSISNIIFTTLGEKVSLINLEGSSTGFHLNSAH